MSCLAGAVLAVVALTAKDLYTMAVVNVSQDEQFDLTITVSVRSLGPTWLCEKPSVLFGPDTQKFNVI